MTIDATVARGVEYIDVCVCIVYGAQRRRKMEFKSFLEIKLVNKRQTARVYPLKATLKFQ